MPADPKQAPPIRDPKARKAYHASARRICVICPETRNLSLHHVFNRDDVPENFVLLCGDGVLGCHGQITAESHAHRARLGKHIKRYRPDIIAHVIARIDVPEADRETAARDWFARRLFVTI